MPAFAPWAFMAVLIFALQACGTHSPLSLPLLPAPDVYEPPEIDPFLDENPIATDGHPGMLYATDRQPAADKDRDYTYYTHHRGNAMRLGMGDIELVARNGAVTWADAKNVALLKDRTEDYPLRVTRVEEFGIHPESLSPTAPAELLGAASDSAVQRFTDAIEDRLQESRGKDVYIYVHGYKVGFENPLLVASELWHYLGYNGAFIAYSWPTKQSVWSYVGDTENALNSARRLRLLLLDVARRTTVERIHIIGFSAGTRLVSRMLADLGQYGLAMETEEIRRRTKLDNVILIGSDVDADILGGYLLDGALRIPDSLTIYQSTDDGALNASRAVYGQSRAGQTIARDELDEAGNRWLLENPVLRLIDVSDAADASAGNGHTYLRASPWVSSDILMTLMYDLPPGERGLVRDDDYAVWQFPDDYVEKLRATLRDKNPPMFTDLETEPEL